MSLTAYEREFALNFTDADDEAYLLACNRPWITKLDKLVARFPDIYKIKKEIIIDGEVVGKEYTFSKDLVTIRSPREKREYSEGELEELRERGRKLAESRKS